jgi:lauroyl/myristoyl acyltransferase
MQFITPLDLYILCVVVLIQLGAWFSYLGMRAIFINTTAVLAYHLSRRKRRLSEQNVSETFENQFTKDQLRTIVKSSFYQFWLEVFSVASPSFSEAHDGYLEIHGLEFMRQAVDSGKGAILWEGSHFGRRSLMKKILHENGFRILQVYGETHAGGFYRPCPASWVRRRIIKRFFDDCEKEYVAEILNLPLSEPLPVIRILLERLKENRIICVAGDSPLGWSFVRKHFLRGERAFSTGMVSLSRITGAPILPIFCVQESNDRIVMTVEPPIRPDAALDRDRASEACISRYVDLLESYIKKYPGQYFHWHRLAPAGQDQAYVSYGAEVY